MKHVVIIDDHKTLGKTIELLLQIKGYVAKSFAKVKDAGDYIESSSPVDILIVDYAMPQLNGDEFIRRVRRHLPDQCKIIMISGDSKLVEVLDFESLGVSAFLTKPFELTDLYEVLSV